MKFEIHQHQDELLEDLALQALQITMQTTKNKKRQKKQKRNYSFSVFLKISTVAKQIVNVL